MSNKPASALSSPRFCNTGNFIRLPKVTDFNGYDFAIIGIYFDSHADINDLVFGEKYNHGTPFRRAVEEGLIDPHKSVQIGMRGSLYDPDEFKKSAELGFKLIPTHKVREMGFESVTKQILERVGNNKAFFTFDIDFVDPAYAPGTGTPDVGGFTSHEALSLVRSLSSVNFVGFDVFLVSHRLIVCAYYRLNKIVGFSKCFTSSNSVMKPHCFV